MNKRDLTMETGGFTYQTCGFFTSRRIFHATEVTALLNDGGTLHGRDRLQLAPAKRSVARTRPVLSERRCPGDQPVG